MARKSDSKDNSGFVQVGKPAQFLGDKVFNTSLLSMTILVVVILIGIFITLFVTSLGSLKEFGFRFFVSDLWNARKIKLKSISEYSVIKENTPRLAFRVTFTEPVQKNTLDTKSIAVVDASGKELAKQIEFTDNLSNLIKEFAVTVSDPMVSGSIYYLELRKTIADFRNQSIAYEYSYKFSTGTLSNTITIVDSHIFVKQDGELLNLEQEDEPVWYGAMPFIIGTLLTSLIALLISIPFSISVAIFLGEYMTSGPLSTLFKTTNELLAGIPSIIYGFWAFFFLVASPQSGGIGLGSGILTASVVLAIMIIPYSSSIAREVISLVPEEIKHAAFAMGATRFEVVRRVILPYASSGIFAGHPYFRSDALWAKRWR